MHPFKSILVDCQTLHIASQQGHLAGRFCREFVSEIGRCVYRTQLMDPRKMYNTVLALQEEEQIIDALWQQAQ